MFHLWVGKIPWRRAWQTTPVFWPAAWGLTKCYDSQDKADSIVKRLKWNQSWILNTNWWWYQFAAWAYKWGPTKLQFEVSSMEWKHCPWSFQNWGTRLLLTSDLALFNLDVGQRSLVMYVLWLFSVVSLSPFFQWLYIEIKLNSHLLNTETVCSVGDK